MNLDTLNVLLNLKNAIGEALPLEQQLFVSTHYPDLVKYLHTDTGKKALQMFVEDWQTAP
jgi:hypothetical protein